MRDEIYSVSAKYLAPFCVVYFNLNTYFVCFPQLDTLLIPGVFVFIIKWGHAALFLLISIHQLLGRLVMANPILFLSNKD